MPTPQDIKKDVMSKVNSVMAAIDLYPDISITNTQLSFSKSFNPIDLFVDFFKTTKGYDWLIDTVSNFITYAIPPLEIAVKGVLLSNIRVMLSCSVNPLITEKIINDGIVFNINQIDLMNMFKYSPLDKRETNLGRYYYFGCDPEDGISTIDDVKMSRDFNAVLWYCKNTPGERVVWRRDMDVTKPYNIKKKTSGGNVWYKQVKSNGIATVQFNGRSSGLTKADASGGIMLQEPINNCIHVFIGCCTPIIDNNNNSEDISKYTTLVNKYNQLNDTLDEIKKNIKKGKRKNKSIVIENGSNIDALNDVEKQADDDFKTIEKIRSAIKGIDIDNGGQNKNMGEILDSSTVIFKTTFESLTIEPDLMASNINKAQADKIDKMREAQSSTKHYPSAISNYYYMHPLFEWNTDFVMSMKLFDEKVVTTQLIESLTKCLSLNSNFDITVQMQFVQQQLRQLIEETIETDSGTISDCFFSFTNESYNKLLNEVELNRVRLHSIGGETINEIPSAENILSALNEISHDASKEELKSVVSTSLMKAVNSTNPNYENGNANIKFDAKANFSILDNLLTELVYVLVSSVIQPKIYVLLMINLKLMGNDPNFDLAKFMQQFSDLISQIIKEIRDKVFEYFKGEMMKVFAMLTKTLAIKLSIEQYQYYINLFTKCVESFKLRRNQLDWMQDDVNYADITELNNIENQEC